MKTFILIKTFNHLCYFLISLHELISGLKNLNKDIMEIIKEEISWKNVLNVDGKMTMI